MATRRRCASQTAALERGTARKKMQNSVCGMNVNPAMAEHLDELGRVRGGSKLARYTPIPFDCAPSCCNSPSWVKRRTAELMELEACVNADGTELGTAPDKLGVMQAAPDARTRAG